MMDKDCISSKELKWTKDKPTEEAYYWWKRGFGENYPEPEMIFVYVQDCCGSPTEYRFVGSDNRVEKVTNYHLFDSDNLFYGPLTPPGFEDCLTEAKLNEAVSILNDHKPPTFIQEDDEKRWADHKCNCSQEGAVYAHPELTGYKCVCEEKKAKEKADDDDKEELYNYLKSTGPRHCVDWVRRNGGTLDDYMDYIKEELKKEKADEDKPIGHCALDGSDFIPFKSPEEEEVFTKEILGEEPKCDHIVGATVATLHMTTPDYRVKYIHYSERDVFDEFLKDIFKFKYCPLCGEEL